MISKRADSAKGAASPLTFTHNINCPFESCRFVSVLLLSLQIAKWKEQINENNQNFLGGANKKDKYKYKSAKS